MNSLYSAAIHELGAVLAHMDDDAVSRAVDGIALARQVALYGVGREGLQIKGMAMRLYHLGLNAHMVGDMNCPPLGPGDLLICSAGPGHFSTVQALLEVARRDGSGTLVITAKPDGQCALTADAVLLVPAQTMADDHQPAASVLPMGSLYEGVLYLLFETMILRLRDRLHINPEAMRSRHTNLE